MLRWMVWTLRFYRDRPTLVLVEGLFLEGLVYVNGKFVNLARWDHGIVVGSLIHILNLQGET